MEEIKRRIGIMGGTFDPIHNAHLELAKQAYGQFSLDGIWMLPNGNPPHKRDTAQADVEHRIRMLRLAIRDFPYISLCELERSGAEYHYTYETLWKLNSLYPDTRFYFIMGADSLFEFDTWREPQQISRECVLLAATRNRRRPEQLMERIRELKERYGADIRLLNTPDMEIASEEIRRRIARGEDVSEVVPPEVADYIREHGLYMDMQEEF